MVALAVGLALMFGLLIFFMQQRGGFDIAPAQIMIGIVGMGAAAAVSVVFRKRNL